MTRREVLDLAKNKARFVTHIDNGHRYVVKETLPARDAACNSWYEAVLYEDIDTNKRYVRSVESFCVNFKIIED